jgi:membrane protease subunit HflK
MRRAKPSGEFARLAEPVWPLTDWLWGHLHWWIGAMFVLYVASGITFVKPDEVAVVLRWGRIVGSSPAEQIHGPGPFYALPPPIDQVERLQVQKVYELNVTTLSPPDGAGGNAAWSGRLDPVRVGYALTGDRNIVHAAVTVRFQIADPVTWLLAAPNSEDILRTEVSAAMVRSLGEMPVDRVLSEGRRDLITTTTARVQAGLDAAQSGLRVSALELVGLSPPAAVTPDFDAVQTAYIEAETAQKTAAAYREDLVPRAQAAADSALKVARADAAAERAKARGEAGAFLASAAEFHAHPGVARQRLYRSSIEVAFEKAGRISWVPPPPARGRYSSGFRIMLSNNAPNWAGTATQSRSLSSSSPGEVPVRPARR